jgi:hypothetical protein
VDRIVDVLTLAGVLALVALPVAVIVIGVLVWINRRRARAIKDWAARHGDLKRRLADVEALRRAEPINLAEHPDHAAIRYLEELRLGEGDSVTILCDDPEAESAAKRMAIVCNGAWTQWEDRRFYGESIVQCLAKGVHTMRIMQVDRTLTAPVPSMIRDHLGDDAIEWTPEAGRAAVDRERLK